MKLFIIGNGFDVGHNLACRYSDFQKYLSENRNEILEIMEKYYYVGEGSELWSDFERSLEENIMYDSLTEIIGENSPNLASDDFRDRDWYDAQIYIEQDCDELLEYIRSGFEEWISSLETLEVGKQYNLDQNGLYINFNYTEILENSYNISVSNILHIHNKVGEELIFGHGKKTEDFNVKKALYGDENALLNIDDDGTVESEEIGHEKFGENAVVAFYDKMRKNTEEIIESNKDFFNNLFEIDEIVVLGHSYNEIDFPYFYEIAKSVKENAKWTLCYYSDDDKQNAEKVMIQLGIPKNSYGYKHSSELKIENTQLDLF